MLRVFTILLSIIASFPLGWGVTELTKPSGDLRVAAYCCLFAAVVGILGMWAVGGARENTWRQL